MFTELSRLAATPLRLKILKFYTFQPESSHTVRAVANALGSTADRVATELRALVACDIMVQRGKEVGAARAYKLNEDNPIAKPLAVFLEIATLPDVRELAACFRGVRGLSLVVVAGVLLHEGRGAVDLLVVTSRPKDPSVTKAITKAERLMAAPLRYLILDPSEYDDRIEVRDRLVRDIFEFRHRVLIGKR